MMDVYSYEQPATVGILLMFIVSGLSKIFSRETRSFDVNRLRNFVQILPISLPESLLFLSIFMVGFFEIFSSGVIIHDVFYDKTSSGRLSSRSESAVVALIIFSTIATLMFYVFPPKFRPLLANVSVISGLLFVYQIIQRNSIQRESTIPNETIQRVEKLMKQKSLVLASERQLGGRSQLGTFAADRHRHIHGLKRRVELKTRERKYLYL